jgi:hypothetical protein
VGGHYRDDMNAKCKMQNAKCSIANVLHFASCILHFASAKILPTWSDLGLLATRLKKAKEPERK